MTEAVVGREPELARAVGFLDAVGDGAAGLVFEGEPGIGKTTLWRTTVALHQGVSLNPRPSRAASRMVDRKADEERIAALCGTRDPPPTRSGRGAVLDAAQQVAGLGDTP